MALRKLSVLSNQKRSRQLGDVRGSSPACPWLAEGYASLSGAKPDSFFFLKIPFHVYVLLKFEFWPC